MNHRVPMLAMLLLASVFGSSSVRAADACTDGQAGNFACSHVDLLSHLSITDLGGDSTERVNDIWGWTDPVNGDEYAIVGMFNGTAFVRLGDGTAPVFLGRLPDSDGMSSVGKPENTGKFCHDECEEGASSWRDIKVYANHAFIVSEAPGHGMQVFDLTHLSGVDSPPVDGWDMDAYYDGVGHAHNIVINEDRGRAYIVGANGSSNGGLHMVDISDPVNPVFLADINGDGYTHDAQCVNYAGPSNAIPAGADICFAANEDTLTIWNVTDPDAPEIISKTSYSNVAYTHQLWLSKNQRYAYLNDELDESTFGTRTNTRILDLQDPANPVFLDDYLASTLAIDHNNYVKGNLLFQSNYLAGLRILDIGNPRKPVEAAYFDVSGSDTADFAGTWSNYPYFDSGLVVVSDIHAGLFVVRPTLDDTSAQANLEVDLQSVSADDLSYELTIENVGGIDLDEVLVTAHLPAGNTLSISDIAPAADWSCNDDARVIECRAATIAAGDTLVMQLAVTAPAGMDGDLVAMAYAKQIDRTPGDNRATLQVSDGNADNETTSVGGSGGGAPGWLLLGMLVGMLARRR